MLAIYIYIYIRFPTNGERIRRVPKTKSQGPCKSQGPRIKDADIYTHALNAIRSHAFAKLYWICCKHVLTRRASLIVPLSICNLINSLRPSLILS